MHIPDGYLSPSSCATLYAAAVPFWSAALRKLRREMQARFIPLVSLFAAFSFVIMMFNVPSAGRHQRARDRRRHRRGRSGPVGLDDRAVDYPADSSASFWRRWHYRARSELLQHGDIWIYRIVSRLPIPWPQDASWPHGVGW